MSEMLQSSISHIASSVLVEIDSPALIRLIDELLTLQQVRLRIQEAMISGLLSPDPVIKMRWKEIPCEGEVPTPEELILYLAERVAGAAQDSCGE